MCYIIFDLNYQSSIQGSLIHAFDPCQYSSIEHGTGCIPEIIAIDSMEILALRVQPDSMCLLDIYHVKSVLPTYRMLTKLISNFL